jgi:hypothetical protein
MVNFSAFSSQIPEEVKIVLWVNIPITVMRLLYEAAQVFKNTPLPASGWLMATLFIYDWVS